MDKRTDTLTHGHTGTQAQAHTQTHKHTNTQTHKHTMDKHRHTLTTRTHNTHTQNTHKTHTKHTQHTHNTHTHKHTHTQTHTHKTHTHTQTTRHKTQTKRNETKRNTNKTKQNETKRNETKQTKPNQTKPNQTKPNQTKPNKQTNSSAGGVAVSTIQGREHRWRFAAGSTLSSCTGWLQPRLLARGSSGEPHFTSCPALAPAQEAPKIHQLRLKIDKQGYQVLKARTKADDEFEKLLSFEEDYKNLEEELTMPDAPSVVDTPLLPQLTRADKATLSNHLTDYTLDAPGSQVLESVVEFVDSILAVLKGIPTERLSHRAVQLVQALPFPVTQLTPSAPKARTDCPNERGKRRTVGQTGDPLALHTVDFLGRRLNL